MQCILYKERLVNDKIQQEQDSNISPFISTAVVITCRGRRLSFTPRH